MVVFVVVLVVICVGSVGFVICANSLQTKSNAKLSEFVPYHNERASQLLAIQEAEVQKRKFMARIDEASAQEGASDE